MNKIAPVSISVRLSLRVDECLALLREKLQREQFRIVAQVQFDREFEKTLGVRGRRCTVLVVWNSFYAYQASLSGVNGGLFLPFNVSVSEEAGSTLITTMNHSLAGSNQGSVGVQILAHQLHRRMEQIFMELAVCDATAANPGQTGASDAAIGYRLGG